MKTQALKKNKFIWVLTTQYFQENEYVESNMYFTSKAKAIDNAQRSCIFTLDGELKELSSDLLVVKAKRFNGLNVYVTIKRDILF